MANSCSRQLEDERNRQVMAVEAFKIADQSTQDLRNKLEEEEKARRSADSALERTPRGKPKTKGYSVARLRTNWLLPKDRFSP